MPLITTLQSTSDTESRPVVEAETEEVVEVKKKKEKVIGDELHASNDGTVPSKLHDFCADSHGVEGNRRPSIHVVSDL